MVTVCWSYETWPWVPPYRPPYRPNNVKHKLYIKSAYIDKHLSIDHRARRALALAETRAAGQLPGGRAFLAASALLYFTILYYTILYYTTLYYTLLYYTILYYILLYYTVLYWPPSGQLGHPGRPTTRSRARCEPRVNAAGTGI